MTLDSPQVDFRRWITLVEQAGKLTAEPFDHIDPITNKPTVSFQIFRDGKKLNMVSGRYAATPEEAVQQYLSREEWKRKQDEHPVAPLPPVSNKLSAKADEFARWFGDSKVVKADGKPLIVYHGSDATFRKFAAGEFGFHFGDKDAADMMGTVRAYYLSIQNPLRIPDIGVWSPERVLQHINTYDSSAEEIEAAKRETAELKRQLHPMLDQDDDLFKNRQAHYAWSGPVRELIKRQGYDGFMYRNEAEGFGTSWVAFDPEQIRPARRR